MGPADGAQAVRGRRTQRRFDLRLLSPLPPCSERPHEVRGGVIAPMPELER